jgi:formylglycine-generating enzyme required for sulfatase activity
MRKQRFQRHFRWIALLLVSILIGAGCVGPGAAGPTTAQPTASPIGADLTALKMIVKRLRAGHVLELREGDSVDIQVDDQISVEEMGRGRLRFRDLVVEVFRDTQIRLDDAKLQEGGFILVRFLQVLGHTRTELNERANTLVKIETDYATITAIDSGTEVLVCHGEALTCMATLKGKAEVEAQGQVVTVRAGEATYVFPGEPPEEPTCVDPEEARRWLDRKRGTEAIEPFGALVIQWSETPPCPTTPLPPPIAEPVETLPSPTAPSVTPLPSGEGMVRIEGGQYEIGRAKPDDYHISSRKIEVAGFWIDQYEVSNAQYQVFLGETGHPLPASWPGEENHPVKGVTWDQAAAYCAWANKRLPTEAEWEIAARGPGPEPPLYPWGPDPFGGGQTDELPLTDTYAVGSKPFNKSPFEVYDMAGNVWEWVGEPYDSVPDGYQILRGGRHGLLRDMAYRQPAEPTDQRFVRAAGFRCAADRTEGE